MEFKTKKIRKNIPEKKKLKEVADAINPSRKRLHVHLPAIISLLIILALFIGIAKAISSINFTVFLKIAGDQLQTDAYDHTNFLILGTGNREHEGGNLTDSIIVASLDDEQKLISLISIPRDLYVKDDEVGSSRINEIYFKAKSYYKSSTEGIKHMQKKVETIMGIPIHYYLKVDFDGFKELVDALGGIDIYVENAIYDPSYPKDGTFLYETFSISAGQHHLDGATALKYARSRKTTSDFDRATRQQQIIYAIKEKALQSEVIFSKEKISNILDTLNKNIETNLTVKEILTLGAIANDYSPDKILHRLIHDDPTKCGGFVYTPAREFYNGMFVLIPAGGFEFIHLYSDLNFNLPQIAKESAKIIILNSTAEAGIAGEAKQILQRFCFDIVDFSNGRSKDIAKTTYYYKENPQGSSTRPEALKFLQKLIPGQESTQIPQEYLQAGYPQMADLIIEIGSDYTESENYIDDPFFYLPAAKAATPEASTDTTTDTAADTAADTTTDTAAETAADATVTPPATDPVTSETAPQ